MRQKYFQSLSSRETRFFRKNRKKQVFGIEKYIKKQTGALFRKRCISFFEVRNNFFFQLKDCLHTSFEVFDKTCSLQFQLLKLGNKIQQKNKKKVLDNNSKEVLSEFQTIYVTQGENRQRNMIKNYCRRKQLLEQQY